MAIYHLSAQIIGRKSGGNAKAAAAYRAGEKIAEFDYSRKSGVDYKEILTPKNAPEWCKNRSELWAIVESVEKRKDAQLCREINLALPLELNSTEREELLKGFAEQFVSMGMVADITIHGQTSTNPHAHIMLTTRELTSEGFGQKVRDWNRRELLDEWRSQWAELANKTLEHSGHEARIDHRSLKRQGIDREPTRHKGKILTWIERKEPTLIGELRHQLAEHAKNEREIALCRAELSKLERGSSKEQKCVIAPSSAFKAQIEKTPEQPKEPEQTHPAPSSPKKEPLQGVELRTIAEQRAKQAQEVHVELELANRNLAQARYVLLCAQKARDEHNKDFDKMGFFKKVLKTSEINARAKEIERVLDVCENDYVKKEHVVNELTKKNTEYNAKAMEARTRYERSPYGQAVAQAATKRDKLEKQYGQAVRKLVCPNAPSAADSHAEYKQYLDGMQTATPEQLAEMVKRLQHAERRYEAQELFYTVAERTSNETSISGRQRIRDEMLKEWDKARPEQRAQMEQESKEFVKTHRHQRSCSMER